MTSKNFPAIDPIDFHANKLVPESDTAKSKNHVLLPFPYEDEGLPTALKAEINCRNNANINNNTINDTNSILIQSNTTRTATNNRTANNNTNNNAVNDSNKLLTPTSASTTTTNNSTNSVNANNSENNTSSKLIPSSIDEEERNESEKCGNAAKQDAKEKISVLNREQWKKGTTLIAGDLILAGLREPKVSRSKRIKVPYFPGGKTEDLRYHLTPCLEKEPDNIIIHIGTNDNPYKTEDFLYKELVNVKETIIKFHPNCKNLQKSSPIIRTDKKEANNILKKYNNILKQEERNVIFHNKISASHLHRDGLPLNLNGTLILAGNLLSRIRTF